MLHRIFAHISPETPKSASRPRAFTALLLTMAVLLGLSASCVANAKTKTANPAATTGLSQLGSLHVKNQQNFSPRVPLASAPKAAQMRVHPSASGISAAFTDFSYYPSFNSNAFTEPFGVAVDTAGNVYVADAGAKTVYIETPKAGAAGGYTQTVVATGFSFIYGINVDSYMNVYVDDYGTGTLYIEKPNGDGTYTQGIVDATLGEPLANVVDSYGDVYVADGPYGVIEEYNNGNGTYTAYQIDAGDFVSPNAIALDTYGNLYVGDYIYTAASPYSILYSLTSFSYGSSNFSAPNQISNNLYGVSGVGVTSNGTLYVADTGLGKVPSVLYTFIPTAQGTYNQFFLSDNVYLALGIAIDSLGNVYTSDVSGADVLEISDNFGAVQVGMANSANNYVTANFMLGGTGTIASTLTVQTEGSNDIAFTDSGLGNCAGAVVPTVTYCSAVIQFAPTTPGVTTGNIALFDSLGNYITFTPSFSGTGIAPRASYLPGTWSYIYNGGALGIPYKNFAKDRTKLHEKIPQQAMTAFKGLNFSGSKTYPGNEPVGIAVDPSGNYFVADPNSCQIFASFDGGVTWTTLSNAGGAVCPSGGLAVDGNGNVFFTAWGGEGGALIVVDARFGNPATLGAAAYGNPYTVVYQTNTGDGYLHYANNLTVDAYDNVYFTGSDDCNEGCDAYAYVIPAEGYFNGSDPSAVSRLNGSFKLLSGIAADNYGDIFVSDYYGGQVVEYYAESNGTYSKYSIARGLDTPSALTLTAASDLFIVDSGDDTGVSALYLGTSNGLCCGASYGYNLTPLALSSYYINGDAYFWDFTIDQNNNFYLTDAGYWGGLITQIDVNDPPSLSFATTDVGLISTDSPETVFLTNTGNDKLVLPAPASGFNPSISPSFLLNSGSFSYFPGGQLPAMDCPLISSGGTNANVNWDSACALPVSFAPLVAGSISGTLVVTNNSLYGSSAVPLAKGATHTVKGHANLELTKDGKLAKNAHPMSSTSTAQTINLSGTGVDYFSITFTVTNSGTVPPVVKAGGSLDLSFVVAPTSPATYFPLPVVMTAYGGPQGTSYTFNPSVVPAGAGSTTVVLTINIPIDYVAKNDAPAVPGQNGGTNIPVAPLALALLLLPMAGKLRKTGKRMSRMVAMLLLAIAGITATATLIGCGANKAAVYQITVVGTAGALSNSSSFDITVAGR